MTTPDLLGAVGRLVLFACTLAAIGSRWWRDLAPQGPLAGPRSRALVDRVLASLLAGALVAVLVAQVRPFLDPGTPAWPVIETMLFEMPFGWGWLSAAIAAALFGAGIGSREARVAMVPVVLLVMGMSLSGHAAAVPGIPVQAVACDVVHVVAAGSWIGTLGFLGLASRTSDGTGFLGDVVPRYSRVARVAVVVLVASGFVSATLHLGSWTDLWRSDYGRLLSVKVIAFGIAGAIGASNWLLISPRLAERAGAALMRRAVLVELAAAFAALAATALLVHTAPPEHDLRGAHAVHAPVAAMR